MGTAPIEKDEIFHAATELLDPVRRAAFLAAACQQDAELRAEVDALLKHDSEAGCFLEHPAVNAPAELCELSSDEPHIVEAPGTVIGPYKLLEQIGEGGMGVVYLAEQQAPVRRRVALKVVKPGMDTRQVMARFEAERQALALMDHANIARVFDAGATDSGRPFFVMELVRGIPITDYCDENNLSVPQRLDLFVQVCHAVQHAHQKGIIHRDIKSTNVLIALQDGAATPKVIDFGIAKAINQQLTEKTLFTDFALMVGTPLYMSPEQAEMTSADVDTRSDIYSLGVLLYELLTGKTPFDTQRLREATYNEIRRIICEEEPPRPSTRFSALGPQRAAMAAHRKVDPSGLCQLLSGDLDWIVMKAIEKDRTRRYETANALARDIQRHLTDEPVEACPPSAAYRFRKFARRNRWALTTGVLVSTALVLGTVASTWQAIRALRAERLAQAARTAEADQRAQAEANFQQARKTVDKYFTLVSENKLLDVPGMQPLRAELLEAALGFYEELGDRRSNEPAVLADLAVTYLRVSVIYHATDRNDEAVATLVTGLEIVEKLLREHPNAIEHFRKLGGVWKGWRRVSSISQMPRDPAAAFRAIQKMIGLWERFAETDPATTTFQSDLAATYFTSGDILTSSGRTSEGLGYFRKAQRRWETLVRDHATMGQHRADLARTCDSIAFWSLKLGDASEAETELQRSLALRERLVEDYPDVPQYRLELAESLGSLGDRKLRAQDQKEAEAAYERSVKLCRQLVDSFPTVPLYQQKALVVGYNLIKLRESMNDGSTEQAEKTRLQEIKDIIQLSVDFPHYDFFHSHLAHRYHELGVFYSRHGRSEDALAAYRQEKKTLEPLLAKYPKHRHYRADFARSDWFSARILAVRDQVEEAEGLNRQSVESYTKLVQEFPATTKYATELAECRRSLDEILSRRATGDSPAELTPTPDEPQR